jgi:hypothetical protein
MYFAVRVFKVAPIALVGALLTAAAANAQSTDTATSQVQAETNLAISRNEGESVRDFLARVGTSDQASVSGLVGGMIAANPAEFAQIAAVATDAGTPSALAAEIIRGIALSAQNPVTAAQQASSYALANPANPAAIVTLARAANEPTFSEVMGEGLALAANTRRSEGNTGAASGIATQATAPTAPTELTRAFSDNFVQTAAPAAAAAGAAGGGNISAGTSGPLGGPSSGDSSVAQSGGAGSGIGGGSFSFGSRVTYVTNNTATLPVPAPEAGAGLGALVMGGMLYWLNRRKRVDT